MTDDQGRDHERRLGLYMGLKNELNKRELSNAENYDRAILTLSSSAIGLSIALLRRGADDPPAVGMWLLVVSWILFAGAICATLISFFTGQASIAHQSQIGWKLIMDMDETVRSRQNRAGMWTNRLAIAAGALFAAGVVATLFFCIRNF